MRFDSEGYITWISIGSRIPAKSTVSVTSPNLIGGARTVVTDEQGVTSQHAVGDLVVVQQIEGNVFQPLVMSNIVGLHPLVVILSIVAGGILLGVLPGQPGVSWQGHLFGAVGGLWAAWAFGARDRAAKAAGARF